LIQDRGNLVGNLVGCEPEALGQAREMADAISKSAPLAVMLSKAAINRGLQLPLSEGLATESDLAFLLSFTRDRREGVAAFREKRPPDIKSAAGARILPPSAGGRIRQERSRNASTLRPRLNIALGGDEPCSGPPPISLREASR
jgi:hypothetical protein